MGMKDDIAVVKVDDCKKQCEAVKECVGFVTNSAQSRCFFKSSSNLSSCAKKFGYPGGIDRRHGLSVFFKKAFAKELDAGIASERKTKQNEGLSKAQQKRKKDAAEHAIQEKRRAAEIAAVKKAKEEALKRDALEKPKFSAEML